MADRSKIRHAIQACDDIRCKADGEYVNYRPKGRSSKQLIDKVSSLRSLSRNLRQMKAKVIEESRWTTKTDELSDKDDTYSKFYTEKQ